MGYMGTIKEVCARKARKSSVVSCGCYVTVGQLIVRIGGRWVCGYCARTSEYGLPYRPSASQRASSEASATAIAS
jgi:hypothetical protein